MATVAALSRKLLDLLEEERAALLSANLAVLPALVARKEKLVVALNRVNPTQLDPVIALRLGRNQALLQASMAGLRDARSAILGVSGKAEFRTYDRRGNHTTVVPPRHTVPHRA